MINIGRTTETILSSVRDYLSKIFNGRTCIGSQTITMNTNTTTIATLTVPSGATSAEITVDVSAASTNTSQAVRYSLSSIDPTAAIATAGVPLGDFDTIEILGYSNLQAFKAVAVDAVATKYLKVQYFR